MKQELEWTVLGFWEWYKGYTGLQEKKQMKISEKLQGISIL